MTAVAKKQVCGLQPAIDLADLVQQTQQTELTPYAFFVSWHGVLTLAYSGFPEPLANLKAKLNEHCDLPKENSGSKWPKTSLAALKDGKTLTPAQLLVVQSICLRHSLELPKHKVAVEELTIVNYANRCLEKVITSRRIKLGTSDKVVDVSDAQRLNVENVLRESDDPNYWNMVAKDGSRESHYRDPAPGCTLLVPLSPSTTTSGFSSLIGLLQQEIEQELPGMYTFFDTNSWHITLRAISG